MQPLRGAGFVHRYRTGSDCTSHRYVERVYWTFIATAICDTCSALRDGGLSITGRLEGRCPSWRFPSSSEPRRWPTNPCGRWIAACYSGSNIFVRIVLDRGIARSFELQSRSASSRDTFSTEPRGQAICGVALHTTALDGLMLIHVDTCPARQSVLRITHRAAQAAHPTSCSDSTTRQGDTPIPRLVHTRSRRCAACSTRTGSASPRSPRPRAV